MARVLIATFTYPPNKDGVAEAAQTMARGLGARGHEVSVVTGSCSGDEEPSSPAGPRVRSFALEAVPRCAMEKERLEKFLRSERWDVAIFHCWPMWTTELILPVFRGTGTRMVLVSHGFNVLQVPWQRKFPWGLGSWLKGLLPAFSFFRKMKDFAALVFLSSSPDLGAFFDHFLARLAGHPGIHVIENGADLLEPEGSPEDFRRSLGIPPQAKMFVCVANYSHRKDQGFACRAFRGAKLEGAHMVFIGSGLNEWSDRYQREDQARAGGGSLGTVHWLQNLDRKTTLAAIAAADAAVLSARHEAQPIFLLEAMRSSKPWIARRAGCIAGMEGGICVRTEAEMSEAMRRLCATPEEGSRLGKAGRSAILARHNHAAYVDSYDRLVRKLLP